MKKRGDSAPGFGVQVKIERLNVKKQGGPTECEKKLGNHIYNTGIIHRIYKNHV